MHRSEFIGLLALGASLAVVGEARAATNEAAIRIFGLSVRVEPGQARQLGLDYALEFHSYYLDWSVPNAEFFDMDPWASDPPTHFSSFRLSGDPFSGLPPLEGDIQITVPKDLDEDGDGLRDFFEVERPIDVTLGEGSFVLFDAMGEAADFGVVTVHWQRAAGQHRGQCHLTFDSDRGNQAVLSDLEFTHPFEVFEYEGSYRYQPSATEVVGEADLLQVGEGALGRLRGPLRMQPLEADPQNALFILPSSWTNAATEELLLEDGLIERDMAFEYEFFGLLWLEDGYLATTFGPDYELFEIAIDDPNDGDGDDIPDLTDPPVAAPTLSLTWSVGVPVLRVAGGVGQVYELQSSQTLSPPDWTVSPATSITLTQAVQVVQVPQPETDQIYWRLALP